MFSNITMGHVACLLVGLILGWPLYRWIYKRNPTEVDMINATAKRYGNIAEQEAAAFFNNLKNKYDTWKK